MPNYTHTYTNFCDTGGLVKSLKEVSEASFNIYKPVIEKQITNFIDLNSIEIADHQDEINLIGSLMILKIVASTPNMEIVDRGGGGAGAVVRGMISSINQLIDDILIPNGWIMVAYSSSTVTSDIDNCG